MFPAVPAYMFDEEDRAMFLSGNPNHQAVGEFFIEIADLIRNLHLNLTISSQPAGFF